MQTAVPTTIAIFASGNGTNCENIIRHFAGHSHVRVAVVVCNKAGAPVLERARRLGVPSVVVPGSDLADESVILPLLAGYGVDLIVLAGFMLMVPPFLVKAFERRMINIHPSLLPRHGGKGMYGHRVHEAVKASGDTESGITVHYVSDICDGGEIIAQFSTPLLPSDTAADIERKVRALEMAHFPQVIEQVAAASR